MLLTATFPKSNVQSSKFPLSPAARQPGQREHQEEGSERGGGEQPRSVIKEVRGGREKAERGRTKGLNCFRISCIAFLLR